MTTLKILAAGSLRSAFGPLLARYSELTGVKTVAEFAPAGLLRQRIEQGESCDLFASANLAHPQQLQAAGLALAVQPFARNQLCLAVKRAPLSDGQSWLALLADPQWVIATSTPGADPSGDYCWQLFDNIAALLPETAGNLKQRARQLVGGANSRPVPAGQLAAGWLIGQGLADIFIGYAHYRLQLAQDNRLRVVDIPPRWNVTADYGLATMTPRSAPLAAFILSAEGQAFLLAAGLQASH